MDALACILGILGLVYLLWVVIPNAETDNKIRLLREFNKTVQILKEANLSPEEEKSCKEKLEIAIYGKESEGEDGR